MATIHFTGTVYRGTDGAESLTLTQPGEYQVSDAKAAQLAGDFPQEFSLVADQTPAKAPESDPASEKVETPSKDSKAPSRPAKKAS